MSAFVFRGVTLPNNLKESIDAFVQTGRPTGQFLQSCIDNNLREACGRADEISLGVLHVIVAYLYNECPMGCWGFEGAHQQWVQKKREERISA